jgi:hypothetical protein
VDGGRSVGISTMVDTIRLSCSSDPVDLVAQAALPSKIQYGYWLIQPMLDLHTEVPHGMNRAQGLHWQSQLMVIPIPQ